MVADVAAWMKRSLMALALGVLLLAAPTVFAQTAVGDVPPNHWAYEAVKELVSRGYLTVEDGLFHGDQPVDRFTLASVVARILHELETGVVDPRSEEDVELLRRVVNEFRSDLVAAYAQIAETNTGLEKNTKTIGLVEEKLSEVIEYLGDLTAQLDALESRLQTDLAMQEAAQQAALQAEALKLRQAIGQLSEFLEGRVNELSADREALRQEVREMTSSLRSETDDRIAALEASVREALSEKGVALERSLGSQAETISEQAQVISAVDQRLRDESLRLDGLENLLKGLGGDLSGLTQEIEAAIRELRSELNAQSEALAAHQLALREQERVIAEQAAALKRQGDALTAADEELLKGIESALLQIEGLRAEIRGQEERLNQVAGSVQRLEGMKAQIEGVERQVLAMQSQIGLSEEQLRALSDQLMKELESQYQHSFVLARTVSDELKALKEEFQSYRQSTERELSGAKSAQTFGMIGALLGLIGLVAK